MPGGIPSLSGRGADVQVEAVNVDLAMQALNEAPQLAYRLLSADLRRFAGSFRKQFIRQRLSGPPGIRWKETKKKVGGNVQSDVLDEGGLTGLGYRAKISALLRAHELGGTIRPKRAKGLAIPLKPGLPHKVMRSFGSRVFLLSREGQSPLLVRKDEQGELEPLYIVLRQVTLPARLGFVAFWRARAPRLIKTLETTLRRSLRLAMEQRMKSLTSLVTRAANA